MWRHQLEKVSVGKALNLCWLLCVYLSMYNTHPLLPSPLFRTAFAWWWHLRLLLPVSIACSVANRICIAAFGCFHLASGLEATRCGSVGLAWPPNKAEGSKFLNAAPTCQIQLGCRYTTNSSWQPQIAFGHERAVPDKPSDCLCDCDGDCDCAW